MLNTVLMLDNITPDNVPACHNTDREFKAAIGACRRIFVAKLGDYGPSWRILRPAAVTDQLYIKAKRIRRLEESGVSAVGEGILPEFMAIVNYAAIGVIQLRNGATCDKDMSSDEATVLYDKVMDEAYRLMRAKNQDYDEAWRMMRVLSYTDFILTKIARIKEIEGNGGYTQVSEGIDSNYFDILNYAIFGVIKLSGDE